jgi:phospholipase C
VAGLASVDHVVVLMLENRSFDHLLGSSTATPATSRLPVTLSRV